MQFKNCVTDRVSLAKPARYRQHLQWQHCLLTCLFGTLILRKIIKIVDTRCHILKLKCTKVRYWLSRLGLCPRPTPPDLLAGFKGLLLRGRKGVRRAEGKQKRKEKDATGIGPPVAVARVVNGVTCTISCNMVIKRVSVCVRPVLGLRSTFHYSCQ